jgi:outer membrane usher protein
MGKTDRNGNLLIPELLPYQENIIDIEPTTLPLDTQIDVTHQTVIPYFESGVLAEFSVKRMQGIDLHLRIPNGKFVPVGAELILNNDCHESYPVGYDGEVYVSEIKGHLFEGSVNWENHVYYFSVPLPYTSDPIIELGDVQCY